MGRLQDYIERAWAASDKSRGVGEHSVGRSHCGSPMDRDFEMPHGGATDVQAACDEFMRRRGLATGWQKAGWYEPTNREEEEGGEL